MVVGTFNNLAGLTRKNIVLALLLLIVVNTYAVETKMEYYSVEHGLSQSTVNSILQDSFGQMWFGTRNGLNMFNGYEFESFLHSPIDTTTIINNEITTLFQLDSTNLLVGTRNGICKFNLTTKQSLSYSYEDLDYNEFVVNKIIKDKKGRIWVAAREGVYLFDNTIDNFVSYTQIDTTPGSANTFAQDQNGNLWLGTSNGLFKLNQNGEWNIVKDFLYNPSGSFENRVKTICFDRYNNLWVGTRTNGVFLISQDGRVKHFKSGGEKNELISVEIREIIEDKKGRIWIGTKEGINVYDPFTQEIDVIVTGQGEINTISQSSVYALSEDAQGNVWVGTWSGGVNRLEVDYNGFFSVTSFTEHRNTLSLGAVSSITVINDYYYVGTEANGVIIMDRDWNTIHVLNVKNTKLRSNHIKKVYRDHNNNLWIGFYDRGIQVYNPRTKRITNDIDNVNVYDIKEYPNNVFWIATRRQLVKLNKNNGQIDRNYFSGLIESTTQQAGATIFIDSKGVVWIGSRFGVDAFDAETGKNVVHFDLNDFPDGNNGMHIFSIQECEDHLIWIGTNQGLYAVKNGKLESNPSGSLLKITPYMESYHTINRCGFLQTMVL